MWEADKAIDAASKRLDYAFSINTQSKYPEEYREAQSYYATARAFRAAGNWDDAIEAANRVLAVLAYIDGKVPEPLPAQYTVRTWTTFKDCFWNIAGRPWAYNDPNKWRILYEANKAKIPDSNNPDLIEPGMVMDIPSISGEYRIGMWSVVGTYLP
jgi:nucleoid-associated protein YgaU